MKSVLGLRSGLLAIGLLIGGVTPVHAQLTSAGLSCNNGSAITVFNVDALACSGAWNGNNMNQQAGVLAKLTSAFSPWTGAGAWWSYVGSSGSSSNAVFQSAIGSTSGIITFATPITGIFALSLKAANQFSLYLFDGGTTGISSIAFTTIGTSVNSHGIPQGLSHASLYDANIVPAVTATPEPSTYLLMLTGLGAIGFVRRRRA
jgi:hypothetical protein